MNENNSDSWVKNGLLALAMIAFIGAGFRVFGSQEDILKRLDEKTLLYISISAILLRFRAVTSFKFGDFQVELDKIVEAKVEAEVKTKVEAEVKEIKEEFDISKRSAEATIYGIGIGKAPNQKQSLLEEDIKHGEVPDDPWKGQFEGESSKNDRELIADITPASNSSEYFYIKLKVKSTKDDDQLKGVVTFYIHPTFAKEKVIVPVINGIAEINLQAWGAFTVGAITEEGTKLELDLAESTDPKLSVFRKR
jgi:hypothetical protein